MADIFGAAVAGLALLTELTKFGIAIRKATKRIKNSRRDIAELTDETVIFAGLCEDFLRTCANDREAKSSAAASSIGPLKAWIKRTSTELCELLRKVEAVGPEPKHQYSLQEVLIAKLEWFFSKDAVRRLRGSLTVARASISGFSNLMCIRKLNEELQMLREALSSRASRQKVELKLGMSVEEKIRMVRQAIDMKGSVHYTNKRILKAAKEEVASKQQATRPSDFDDDMLVDLFDFTESFRAYAKEVMPPVRSEQRRSSRYAPTSTSRSTLSQTPPKRLRPDDFHSTAKSSQPGDLRNSQPPPSHSVTSNVSAGSCSSNSIHSRTSSGSISGTSSSSTPVSRMNNARNANPGYSSFIEPQDFKPRLYINPPNQPILSHPAIISRPRIMPLRKSYQIGRHTIVLDATHLHIDNHGLRFDIYATANSFLQAILEHQDKIDALVEALAMENEEETWDGIPGWLVDAHGVTMQVDEGNEIENPR